MLLLFELTEFCKGGSGEFKLRFVNGLFGGGYNEDALMGEKGPWYNDVSGLE